MGIIVPSIELALAQSNVTLSNAYIAIAQYDVNFRNYSPTLENVPIRATQIQGNNMPLVTTILPGLSVLINYGVWSSMEARSNSESPISMLTRQYPYDSNANISSVYDHAYNLLKTSYADSEDA
jgi:hypothetical protein